MGGGRSSTPRRAKVAQTPGRARVKRTVADLVTEWGGVCLIWCVSASAVCFMTCEGGFNFVCCMMLLPGAVCVFNCLFSLILPLWLDTQKKKPFLHWRAFWLSNTIQIHSWQIGRQSPARGYRGMCSRMLGWRWNFISGSPLQMCPLQILQ